MRLTEIQKLRADDRARIEHGHNAVDVNILGEPGADSRPCTCGKRCMYDSPECRGRTTVFIPGVIVEVHFCAVHLVREIATRSPWKDPPSSMATKTEPRPMRAFAEGLRWLDRYREVAAEVPPPDVLRLPPLSGDDVYALAYAKGYAAGQESILERFVGCNSLTHDEIWRRLQDAIAWSNEAVDRPTVRPAVPVTHLQQEPIGTSDTDCHAMCGAAINDVSSQLVLDLALVSCSRCIGVATFGDLRAS